MNLINQIGTNLKGHYNNIKYHTPKAKLNEQEIEMIKQNGLVHFTRYINKDSIEKNGILGNWEKYIFKSERGFSWYYIMNKETFHDKLDLVHSKGKRKEYDAFAIIKNLNDEQISKLRIRRETDDAIIYPDTLKTNKIFVDKLD
ncbi:hypothetical protein [Ruminococcus albus]|uniref:Uncharacterized protein n=1 Tax=Ruminococcus albus TaxID=1264 RepID=A0A1I1GSG5_RUMAL|nr:hypothetical protein [Ruminococcus albus]SFC14415.1 hypothetical protein SAMN02910406_01215 [Ruminococcus albus]